MSLRDKGGTDYSRMPLRGNEGTIDNRRESTLYRMAALNFTATVHVAIASV